MLRGPFYQTPRLALRPPLSDDAAEVFQRIASDPSGQPIRGVAHAHHPQGHRSIPVFFTG